MPRPLSVRSVPVLVVAAAVAVACATSKPLSPILSAQSLVGTYYLDTLANAADTVAFPNVAGTLLLTNNTFIESVGIIEGPGDTVAISPPDTGTYTISGSTLTETSDNPQIPSVTATASFRGSNDTLDITVTSPAQAAGTYVWVRSN